jgi:glycosyltransferase involved in cell wall biosynthesis
VRILTVATSYPRSPGDWAGRFVRDLNAGIVALGHSVATLAPWAPGLPVDEADAEAGPVERVRFREDGTSALFYGSGAEANARRIGLVRSLAAFRDASRAFESAIARASAGADLLIAHWVFPSAWWAVRAAPRIPVLGIVHGADARFLSRPLAGRLVARRLRGRLTGLVAVSGRALQAVEARVAPGPGRVVVSPMGIDAAVFSPSSAARERGLVASAGRLVRMKGFDLLVQACRGLGVRLVIAGDGPERERLADLAARARVPLELPGVLAPRAVADLFRRAAVVATTSRASRGEIGEGVPLVVLEGLACGAAVVGTRTGGMSEVLPARALVAPEVEPLRGLISAAVMDPAAFRDVAAASRFDRVTVARRVLDAAG